MPHQTLRQVFAIALVAIATASPNPSAIAAAGSDLMDANQDRPLRQPFPHDAMANANAAPMFPAMKVNGMDGVMPLMPGGTTGSGGAYATGTGTGYGTAVYATGTECIAGTKTLYGTAVYPTGTGTMLASAVYATGTECEGATRTFYGSDVYYTGTGVPATSGSMPDTIPWAPAATGGMGMDGKTFDTLMQREARELK